MPDMEDPNLDPKKNQDIPVPANYPTHSTAPKARVPAITGGVKTSTGSLSKMVADSRKAVPHVSSVLKAAVVFECKQGRGDLVRDNKRRALLSERIKTLENRKQKLESLLHVHLPHLANGESLFPEFDSYRLREHNHAGYKKLLREMRIAKRSVFDGTKFDRLFGYRVANLHYLVAEENLIEFHEIPMGWGLLIRRDDGLELVTKPVWQTIGVEEQLVFLQRISAKKSIIDD
jgi:hypothetical protein